MKYPTFASLQAREKSFTTWSSKQSIHQMIEAGFFYTGKSDEVYCFYCGLSLHQWEEGDNPKTEHLKWSKYCGYISDSTSGVDVCGNIPDEVSDHPPKNKREKRRNTL